MSSLTDRFRSGAGKAAFEADKLRRLTLAQNAIRPLRGDADRAYFELGKLAYLLHTRGAITQAELLTACRGMDDIQAKIAAAEAEVESIRAEEYVEPLSSGLSKGELICPNGHGALSGDASFCQKCGAAGVKPTVRATVACTNCGTGLEVDALFCAACGTPVRRCASCSAPLLPDAAFCAECGTPAISAPASPPASSQAGEHSPAQNEVRDEWLPLDAGDGVADFQSDQDSEE